MTTRLGRDFFARDTRQVARELLGAMLVVRRNRRQTAVRIVETEAYRQDDPACHAWGLRHGIKNPDARAAFLFRKPGLSYVYLCYGMHYLFNVVTEPEGRAGAVLVRAVEPIAGIKHLLANRGQLNERDVNLCNGPGKLTTALGIAAKQHGVDLSQSKSLFIEASEPVRRVHVSPRVGISQAQDYMWRYYDADSRYVGRVKENKLSRSL